MDLDRGCNPRHRSGARSAADVDDHVVRGWAVEKKIAQLSPLRQELRRMIKSCRNGAVADCQIVGGLAHIVV